jgi:hypothetical protein
MSISRTADYTIQGFIYQFNKTLEVVLSSGDDSEICVEGIIEDIVVTSDTTTQAIQCKYHESRKSFVLSDIYKPVLQMLQHYTENPSQDIQYNLYCYFPDKTNENALNLSVSNLNSILDTGNSDLQKYTSSLKGKTDLEGFISKFHIAFGKSLEEITKDVKQMLIGSAFSTEDVDEIFYPNAIQEIAMLAIKHEASERKITKANLLAKLKSAKSTAISRWTLSLITYDKVMEAKRKQLKPNLSINTRLRYFLFNANDLLDFDDNIVNFVKDYISKYHFKLAHMRTPLFCLDCRKDIFDSITIRMHQKGIRVMDGYVRTYFDKSHFLKEPICNYPKNKDPEREFDVRLILFSEGEAVEILNTNKCDDLYIVSTQQYLSIDTKDVNCESFQLNSLEDFKYVLGLKNAYD